MHLTLYHVDAFTRQMFSGNPAAVCILDHWLPDLVMQAIAGELNLSETAFVVARDDEYRIRWFTPSAEVRLCGHATLASAHVLFHHHEVREPELRFRSLSGMLTVTRGESDELTLDFPQNPPNPTDIREDARLCAGGEPEAALLTDEDLVLVYGDAAEVAILSPDLHQLSLLPYRGLLVTAPCHTGECDFVARYFAPKLGIPEDPVTGSAYTILGPYYREQTGKNHFRAQQVSKRGGELTIALTEDRTLISGYALTVSVANMTLPSRVRG